MVESSKTLGIRHEILANAFYAFTFVSAFGSFMSSHGLHRLNEQGNIVWMAGVNPAYMQDVIDRENRKRDEQRTLFIISGVSFLVGAGASLELSRRLDTKSSKVK